MRTSTNGGKRTPEENEVAYRPMITSSIVTSYKPILAGSTGMAYSSARENGGTRRILTLLTLQGAPGPGTPERGKEQAYYCSLDDYARKWAHAAQLHGEELGRISEIDSRAPPASRESGTSPSRSTSTLRRATLRGQNCAPNHRGESGNCAVTTSMKAGLSSGSRYAGLGS